MVSIRGLLVGRIDRVATFDGNVTLFEYKTGRSNSPEHRRRHQLQLQIYSYLWHESHGEWPAAARVVYHDADEVEIAVEPAELMAVGTALENRVENFINRVATTSDETLSKLASASANTCRFCSYRPVCGAYWNAVEPDGSWPEYDLRGVVEEIVERGDDIAMTLNVEEGSAHSGAVQIILPAAAARNVSVGIHLALINLHGFGRLRTFHSDFASVAVRLDS